MAMSSLIDVDIHPPCTQSGPSGGATKVGCMDEVAVEDDQIIVMA